MALDWLEIASLHLSRVLDFLGYSPRMVNYRRTTYKQFGTALDSTGDSFSHVVSGSKGEGIAKPFESDTDALVIPKSMICIEEQTDIPELSSFSHVLEFNPHYRHPGYGTLKNGDCILSSGSFSEDNEASEKTKLTELEEQCTSIDSIGLVLASGVKEAIDGFCRSGPASTVRVGKFETDSVKSIPSLSRTALNQWLVRPRRHDWPSLELRERLAKMSGNFVAKGCKQSRMENHEWRQCFNVIELELFHSFNDTKRKLYILLKTVLKEILRPMDKNKALTSYCMKNIVFWLSENNPSSRFTPIQLLKMLFQGLNMLKKSLEDRCLPYYMIPGRNLLADVTDELRSDLVKRLNELVQEGPHFLNRCQKFEFARDLKFSELSWFNDRRDEIEILHVHTYTSIFIQLGKLKFLDITKNQNMLFAIAVIDAYICIIEWPCRIKEKLKHCTSVLKRLEVILS